MDSLPSSSQQDRSTQVRSTPPGSPTSLGVGLLEREAQSPSHPEVLWDWVVLWRVAKGPQVGVGAGRREGGVAAVGAEDRWHRACARAPHAAPPHPAGFLKERAFHVLTGCPRPRASPEQGDGQAHASVPWALASGFPLYSLSAPCRDRHVVPVATAPRAASELEQGTAAWQRAQPAGWVRKPQMPLQCDLWPEHRRWCPVADPWLEPSPAAQHRGWGASAPPLSSG